MRLLKVVSQIFRTNSRIAIVPRPALFNHILSHNLLVVEGIAAITTLASDYEVSSEIFSVRKLSNTLKIKKDAPNNVALMPHTFVVPFCGSDMASYHRL